MTAEVVNDDLDRPDRFTKAEREKFLEGIANILLLMQKDKEINLEELFAAKPEQQDENVVKIKPAV
jgi:hypothetical protein